jgi:hypothetical protein
LASSSQPYEHCTQESRAFPSLVISLSSQIENKPNTFTWKRNQLMKEGKGRGKERSEGRGKKRGKEGREGERKRKGRGAEGRGGEEKGEEELRKGKGREAKQRKGTEREGKGNGQKTINLVSTWRSSHRV